MSAETVRHGSTYIILYYLYPQYKGPVTRKMFLFNDVMMTKIAIGYLHPSSSQGLCISYGTRAKETLNKYLANVVFRSKHMHQLVSLIYGPSHESQTVLLHGFATIW